MRKWDDTERALAWVIIVGGFLALVILLLVIKYNTVTHEIR